jgi:hypothetical protein
MLKLVSSGSSVGRREPRRQYAGGRRALLQHIEAQRASGEATQRAVARARHTIVEEHRRADVTLAARLEEIHARLLALSAAVEMEMDRLEIVSADIQRLSVPQIASEADVAVRRDHGQHGLPDETD